MGVYSVLGTWVCLIGLSHGSVSWVEIMGVSHGSISWVEIMGLNEQFSLCIIMTWVKTWVCFHGSKSWVSFMGLFSWVSIMGLLSWVSIMGLHHGSPSRVSITGLHHGSPSWVAQSCFAHATQAIPLCANCVHAWHADASQLLRSANNPKSALLKNGTTTFSLIFRMLPFSLRACAPMYRRLVRESSPVLMAPGQRVGTRLSLSARRRESTAAATVRGFPDSARWVASFVVWAPDQRTSFFFAVFL